MVDKEERFEIAQELQRTSFDSLGSETLQRALARIIEAQDTSWRGVMRRIADLIDRPTCRIWYVPGSADRSCSACGVTFSTGTYQGGDHEEHEFMFCPNCGAEVVSADD